MCAPYGSFLDHPQPSLPEWEARLASKYGIVTPMAPEEPTEDPLDRTRREANAILARASAPSAPF